MQQSIFLAVLCLLYSKIITKNQFAYFESDVCVTNFLKNRKGCQCEEALELAKKM